MTNNSCSALRVSLIEDRLTQDMAREPQWTESIAAGSRPFVDEIARRICSRQQLESTPFGESAWVLRESLNGLKAKSGG